MRFLMLSRPAATDARSAPTCAAGPMRDAGVLGRLFGALQECYRILADVECLCLGRTTVKLQLASTGAFAKFCMHSLQTSWNQT